MTQKEFENKLAEQEVEEKEKINLHDINNTLKGLSNKLQGINFLLKSNSMYILVDCDLNDFKNILNDNYTYLHYLTETEHSSIYLDFGHNKIKLSSDVLNELVKN